jgi:hypothetical protein
MTTYKLSRLRRTYEARVPHMSALLAGRAAARDRAEMSSTF